MNNTVFYPGMLKTYGECPYKYKLKYLDKINVPQNPKFSERGRKIHALANFYLKGQNVEKLEQSLEEAEMALFEKLKNNPMFNKIYLNSEYNLTAKVADYWISGRLDAIVKDGEGIYILDYKTGAVPKNPQYDFQTMLYLTILKTHLTDCQPEKLRFVYIDLKNDKNIEINLSQELLDEYINVISQSCKTISQDSTYPPKTNKCKFCEYNRFCKECKCEET